MERTREDLAAEAVIGERRIAKEPALALIAGLLVEGERFYGAVTGLYSDGKGLLAATDRRLIFASKGLLGRSTMEEFPYTRIESIQQKTGLLLGEISVGQAKITHVDKAVVPRFVRGIHTAMSGLEPAPDITPDDSVHPTPREKLSAAPPKTRSSEAIKKPGRAGLGCLGMALLATLLGVWLIGDNENGAKAPSTDQRVRGGAVQAATEPARTIRIPGDRGLWDAARALGYEATAPAEALTTDGADVFRYSCTGERECELHWSERDRRIESLSYTATSCDRDALADMALIAGSLFPEVLEPARHWLAACESACKEGKPFTVFEGVAAVTCGSGSKGQLLLTVTPGER
ncbi:PH domain-containing protein [Phaeovibrio sulfidiphilus]|uniref:PH domain-containing protein n=1 Tax=Phaeovibrio sulfidiphilus TaxID=1220600 RepID=A0A8J6YYD1_9PROT|nr:PH domain-containing protein [Phaeovibrio sulfidiphilus]MBE1236803.1 PH domain-containing protein [Phaeovibrio sulfidiphilus]